MQRKSRICTAVKQRSIQIVADFEKQKGVAADLGIWGKMEEEEEEEETLYLAPETAWLGSDWAW